MAKEYIERDTALMGVMRAGCLANTVQVLKDIPAADVVEVVRCRDCKHWKKGNFEAGDDPEHLEYGGSCPFVRFARYESNYCEAGERRDNNATD